MIFFVFLISFVPEDSNYHHVMDQQLSVYLTDWQLRWDSTENGLRTVQGCLDLRYWYLNIDTRFQTDLANWLGLRYRYRNYSFYHRRVQDNYFEPFFRIKPDQRLIISLTTHFYKGDNQFGIGYALGRSYLNYLETFFIAEHLDRNFSLQHEEDGPDKIIYKTFPLVWHTDLTRNWRSGRLGLTLEISNTYDLSATDHPASYQEKGRRAQIDLSLRQDIKRSRLNLWYRAENQWLNRTDSLFAGAFTASESFHFVHAGYGYRLNDRWRPTVYLTYNTVKVEDDTSHLTNRVWAYLLDVEYRTPWRFMPGAWLVTFGVQQEFYHDTNERNFKERRFNLNLEYRYHKIWFRFMEAMEGDWPMPKNLHNHTYLQLLLGF